MVCFLPLFLWLPPLVTTRSIVGKVYVDYRIKGHTPLGVCFTLPFTATTNSTKFRTMYIREITPGSILNHIRDYVLVCRENMHCKVD